MKTIKVTHIDTGGHGYLSVSKSDLLKILTPDQISGFSGQSLTRVYLEEDCDASLFMNEAEKKGFVVVVKSSYNLRFKTTHNYNADLFYFLPEIGKGVTLHDDTDYTITEVNKTDFRVKNSFTGQRYRISNAKCLDYIKAVNSPENIEA